MDDYTPYAVTRGGTSTAVPGSPFNIRVASKRSQSGRSYETAPKAIMDEAAYFALFQSLAAPVQIGDIIALPNWQWGANGATTVYGRIISRRGPPQYTMTLQCDLQIIPYVSVHLWTPNKAVNSQIPGTLNIADVSYSDGGQMLAYLEPMNDTERVTHFGRLDIRSNRAFTLSPLVAGAVLVDTAGDCWIAQTASDVWPVTGDARATMIHLVNPPAGIKV